MVSHHHGANSSYTACLRLAAAARVQKHPSRLVLETTNRNQVRLAEAVPVVVVPAYAVVEVHAPAVGVEAIAVAGTPPVAAEADIEELATIGAIAARQGRKPVIIRTITTNIIINIPIPPARRFQLGSSRFITANIIRKSSPLGIARNMPPGRANAPVRRLYLA